MKRKRIGELNNRGWRRKRKYDMKRKTRRQEEGRKRPYDDEEKRRREEEGRLQSMQGLKDNDGWTSWVGGVIGEGTENPGMTTGTKRILKTKGKRRLTDRTPWSQK